MIEDLNEEINLLRLNQDHKTYDSEQKLIDARMENQSLKRTLENIDLEVENRLSELEEILEKKDLEITELQGELHEFKKTHNMDTMKLNDLMVQVERRREKSPPITPRSSPRRKKSSLIGVKPVRKRLVPKKKL